MISKTKKKSHFVYQTTNMNPESDKYLWIYVGKRSTNKKNLEPEYKGSGPFIGKALSKAKREGWEHLFVRDILGIFETEEEAYDYEREIVNEEYIKVLKNNGSYNLSLGGNGGGKNGLVSVKDKDGKTFTKTS